MKIISKNGGQAIPVVKKCPKGWSVSNGTLTQPVGTVWIKNGSFFVKTKSGKTKKNPNYKEKLLVTDEKLFNERIKEKSSYYNIVNNKRSKNAKK